MVLHAKPSFATCLPTASLMVWSNTSCLVMFSTGLREVARSLNCSCNSFVRVGDRSGRRLLTTTNHETREKNNNGFHDSLRRFTASTGFMPRLYLRCAEAKPPAYCLYRASITFRHVFILPVTNGLTAVNDTRLTAKLAVSKPSQ
jgi:hypothetical protein